MRELSDDHDSRVAQLEAENMAIAGQQSQTAAECEALREELATVGRELDAARASVASVLREVELTEASAIAERERTKAALACILRLNEAVLSSAAAAISVEEERSVFFWEVSLELFDPDKNLEVIRRQTERMESLQTELVAKTVEVEYLRSELLTQARELHGSPQEASDGDHLIDQVCETGAGSQEPEAEFTFRHTAEECFASEIFRKDCQVVPSCDAKTDIKMSEDVVEDEHGAEGMAQGTTVLGGNSDAQETRCVVLESSVDDFQSVHSDDKDISFAVPENVAGSQEPGAEAAAPTSSTRPPDEGNPDTGVVVATEIVSKDEEELCTKEVEPEQGSKMDGCALVADADAAANGKLLDAARAEISDLRFGLEEAVRRAELAEEAKAALERELREEIRSKHPSRRRAAPGSEDDARRPARERDVAPPPSPAPATSRPRPTPSRTPGTAPRGPRSARPGGEDMPTPRCVTLGKVLNMKYK